MAVYVIVGLVVLAGLILAYRSFGATAAQSTDPAPLLRTALDAARTAAADLRQSAGTAPLLAARALAAQADARAMRRRLTGMGQRLAAIDPEALGDPGAAVHALLTVAVEELGWGAALCASDVYAAGEGMRTAVATLAAHATSCLTDAEALLESSALAEEVDRPC